MKTRLYTSFILPLVSVSTALASGGHYHPKKVVTCSNNECAPAQIEAVVPEAINDLAKWGKIDKSWAKAKVESVTKKSFKKATEWMITLDDEGKKRYVFITLDGYVAGSNDTGN